MDGKSNYSLLYTHARTRTRDTACNKCAFRYRTPNMLASTAFLLACHKGDAESIYTLARAGCDKAAKDNAGKR